MDFLEALGRAGISTTLAPMVTELHDESAAQAALRALLAADEPPTAVFSAQTSLRSARCGLCAKRVSSVSVALVGFDDIPLGDLLDPGVTVVTQDPQQIGEVAAQRMFARLSVTPALRGTPSSRRPLSSAGVVRSSLRCTEQFDSPITDSPLQCPLDIA